MFEVKGQGRRGSVWSKGNLDNNEIQNNIDNLENMALSYVEKLIREGGRRKLVMIKKFEIWQYF